MRFLRERATRRSEQKCAKEEWSEPIHPTSTFPAGTKRKAKLHHSCDTRSTAEWMRAFARLPKM